MPLKPTSVRLEDDSLKRVAKMAEAMDRPRAGRLGRRGISPSLAWASGGFC